MNTETFIGQTMNIEALLRLADKLEGKGPYLQEGWVSEVEFSLDSWIERSPCGTASCAIGHALSDEWFNDRGFVWDMDVRLPYHEDTKTANWSAVSAFFGIPIKHATHLFSSDAYHPCASTPEDVARRIRWYVFVNGDVKASVLSMIRDFGQDVYDEH
jgi:hypothetical protein